MVSVIPHSPELKLHFAQSAGAVEYTDCTSAGGKPPTPQRASWYDSKQSDGKVPVMLRLWGMRSTSSMPLLHGSLRARVESVSEW